MEQQEKKKASVMGTIGKALLGVVVALLAIGYCTDHKENPAPAASAPASSLVPTASAAPSPSANVAQPIVASNASVSTVPADGERSAISASTPSKRPTFDESAKELAIKYNDVLLGVAPSLMIPSEGKMHIGAKNERFYVIQERVHEGAAVTFEVDNDSDMPFSMGVITAAGTDEQITTSMAVLAGVGAAVFGKGPDASAIAKACTSAAKAKEKHYETVLKGKEVWCGVLDHVLMAGASVPKSK